MPTVTNTITSVLTEDFKKYLPRLLGGLYGVPASQDSYLNQSETLAALAPGQIFWHQNVLKRMLDLSSFLAVDAVNAWVETLSTGVVDLVPLTTPVTHQRAYNIAPMIKCFKIGEGGWINQNGVNTQRQPDPTLRRWDNIQDLDAVVDAGRTGGAVRYPLSSRAVFQKDLTTPTNFTFVEPNVLQVQCSLLAGEFNGNAPSMWEIGLFTEHPTIENEQLMICYGTFPEQIKNGGVTIDNYVNIVVG